MAAFEFDPHRTALSTAPPARPAARPGPKAFSACPPAARADSGREFARRFGDLLCELRLPVGIHQRIEILLAEFADEHPELRASYLSQHLDESYFRDGACGWEAAARSKLHGLAVAGENLYEFVAFHSGLRRHAAPLDTVMNVEELWLETAPEQPFVLRACLYHSFPATTVLYAPTGDSQDSARSFVRRVLALRGF